MSVTHLYWCARLTVAFFLAMLVHIIKRLKHQHKEEKFWSCSYSSKMFSTQLFHKFLSMKCWDCSDVWWRAVQQTVLACFWFIIRHSVHHSGVPGRRIYWILRTIFFWLTYMKSSIPSSLLSKIECFEKLNDYFQEMKIIQILLNHMARVEVSMVTLCFA